MGFNIRGEIQKVFQKEKEKDPLEKMFEWIEEDIEVFLKKI